MTLAGKPPLNLEYLEGIAVVPSEAELGLPWPIEGIIHPGITAITGQPEVGKSTLIQSLCKALLEGDEWVGHKVSFPPNGRIFVGCEDNSEVRRMHQLFPAARAADRLIAARLERWEGRQPLARFVRANAIDLVILDSAYVAAGDVNDQAASTNFLSVINSLGVPVVVVHHEAKGSSSGPAGAQAYRAAYRNTVKVTSTGTPLVVNLKITGNDVLGDKFTVRIDRDTVQAERFQTAVRRASGTGASVGGASRAQIAGALAKAKELPSPDSLRPEQFATRLCGGSRGNADPNRLAEISAALGSEIGHQGVRDLHRNYPEDVQRGYDAAHGAAA